MFSPYYALARRRGGGDPYQHCALNVALYGRTKRWAMTERGRSSVRQSPDSLAIGPSALDWDGAVLTITIDEMTAPIPSRLRGRVRVRPLAITRRRFTLDAEGRHRWWPMAPQARIEVELERPALSWRGQAYFDTNDGDEPLEDAFTSWDWARSHRPDGSVILYNVERRDGTQQAIALRSDLAGGLADIPSPPRAELPPAFWRVPRATRADAGEPVRILQKLEDAPFYSRSVLSMSLLGERVTAVHEALSLQRFASPLVQLMLPFRVPRRFW